MKNAASTVDDELRRVLRLLEQRRAYIDQQIATIRPALGWRVGPVRKQRASGKRGNFKCPHCPRRFPYAMNLGQHVKASH